MESFPEARPPHPEFRRLPFRPGVKGGKAQEKIPAGLVQLVPYGIAQKTGYAGTRSRSEVPVLAVMPQMQGQGDDPAFGAAVQFPYLFRGKFGPGSGEVFYTVLPFFTMSDG
ncbi:hypothetical protein FACS1894158_10330 [Betaproteobacteria bacterium]|nr:hypothetical protein FACS1894158_10330 [Betaproteobacteria bacterium]